VIKDNRYLSPRYLVAESRRFVRSPIKVAGPEYRLLRLKEPRGCSRSIRHSSTALTNKNEKHKHEKTKSIWDLGFRIWDFNSDYRFRGGGMRASGGKQTGGDARTGGIRESCDGTQHFPVRKSGGYSWSI
jgi:hypothetical protein